VRARSVVRAGTLRCLLFAACDTAGVRFIDPPTDDEPERSVTISVRLEDSALAAALGWEQGVPGALISYYRILGESGIQTAQHTEWT